MPSQARDTLVYFLGGLGDLSSRGKNGIEIMKEAVEKEVGIPGKFKLHQYSQKKFLGLHASRTGATIPVFTGIKAKDHAKKLHEEIEKIVEEEKPASLIIVAYSSGSAILRHAIAKNADAEWSKQTVLKRIIYIGGMTTGWEFNSEIPKLYLWLGPTVRLFTKEWFPWQIYRGSKFITETRIALNKLKYAKQNPHPINPQHQPEQTSFVQEDYLLGTKDEFITPADALEIGEPNDGKSMYYQVNGCTHTTILSKKIKKEDKTQEANKEVATFIARQIRDIVAAAQSNTETTSPESIAGEASNALGQSQIVQPVPISSDDIDDYLDPLDNEPIRRDIEVDHVIIVLHGIRDNGMWAKRIGSVIKDTWRRSDSGKAKPRAVRVVSPSYGYFSLWDFLRPGGRRRALEWFQNMYANINALYPSAEISFVGHSNGTYLGAHALRCKEIRYKYMILAGSVLRHNFWIDPNAGKKWKDRVTHLFCLRSLDDFVVALLPGGLELIPILGPLMKLGGAGAYGFKGLTEEKEQRSIRGGHGAGIEGDTWEQLAKFLLSIPEKELTNSNSDTSDKQHNLTNSAESQPEGHLKLVTLPLGKAGHLEPITEESDPKLWVINSILKNSLVFRFVGGLLIVVAVIACFLPLLVPLWIVAGLSAPCVLLEYPMTSMLFIVLGSAVAFSCLKSI